MRRTATRSWLFGGIMFAATVGLGGMTCESEQQSDGERTGEETERADDEASGDSGESELPLLPGDERAGERSAKNPGPEGPGLFFLAGLKGYLEPCGCTADVLLGGAERIVGYVQDARDRYSGVLMVDAGDTFFEHREIEEHLIPQEKAKADVVAAMHREMNTRVLVPGERDFAVDAEFFREKVEAAGAELIGANLTVAGEDLASTAIRDLGEWRIGLIGAVEPKLYEGLEAVDTRPAEPAVDEALESIADEQLHATVVIYHGRLKGAKELLREHPSLDFAVVGHGPREPGQADPAGEGFTLEAYDQGRYLGVAKLFGRDGERPFVDAHPGSKEELEKIEDKIAHVERSLEEVGPAPPGEERPIRQRLRDRLDDLRERRESIESSDLEIPEDRRSFLYRPVAMQPGFPIARSIQKKRVDYNRKLEELTKEAEREVPEVEEGEPTYVGTNQCKSCHAEAHEFWTGTKHADAMETLEERDKAWDERCVKCHVVGYGRPGGSVLGELEYEAEVGGSTIRKNLRDVGCEACHGPGSSHCDQPVGEDGEPQFIDSGAEPSVCKDCHVPEHSPRFNYESYVRTITGEGHQRSGAQE